MKMAKIYRNHKNEKIKHASLMVCQVCEKW